VESHVPIGDAAPHRGYMMNRVDRSPFQAYGATLRAVVPTLIDTSRRLAGSCLARLDVTIWRQIARCMTYLQSANHPEERSD
jgi:hypothetical protein